MRVTRIGCQVLNFEQAIKPDYMKTSLIKVAAVILMVAATISCRKKGTDSMNNADREFLDRTAYAHNGAKEFGALAAAKGENSSVRSYGQTEVNVHTTALNELRNLADDRNYKIPSNMDVEHIGAKVVLDSKSGRNFDSMYMNMQVYDHIQMVGIMQDEIADGNDETLKNYARNFLNTADDHKRMADEIVADMGIKTR